MDELIRFLSLLPEKKREKLERMFKNAPRWLIDSLRIRRIEKGVMFIQAGAPARTIYFLIQGKVKAVDDRYFDVVYDYTTFEAVEQFGELEFYMGTDTYVTNLVSATNCTLLEISRDMYQKWILTDSGMMLEQARGIITKLNSQSQKERDFQFLSGQERMYFILVNLYERRAKDGVCQIRMTKEELANRAGITVRTVTRILNTLADENLIERERRIITVHQEQYDKMKKLLCGRME